MIRTLFFCISLLSAQHSFGEAPYFVYSGHDGGFFSCFLTVVGLLDDYDSGNYSGVEVNFEKGGHYYDAAHGPNWWEYYFEPIKTSRSPNQTTVGIDFSLLCRFANSGACDLSRVRCFELIKKYIKIKPEFLNEAEEFLTNHVHNAKLIGIHYRATDKFGLEASFISKEDLCQTVEEQLRKFTTDDVKIFVATDDDAFLQFIQKKFGEMVISFNVERSRYNRPIHTDGSINGYKKGKEALLDCILLSKCDLIIRTASNLSNAATILNPSVPFICVNRPTAWREREKCAQPKCMKKVHR